MLTPWATRYRSAGLLSLTVGDDGNPYAVFGDDDASFAIAQRVAMCEAIYSPATDNSGQYTVWFIDPASRSWASIDYQPGADTFPVRQMGPRQLWHEVRDAHQWWVDVGSPTVDQWTFTVTQTDNTSS